MDLEELPRLEGEVNKLRQRVGRFDLQVPVQDQLGSYLESLAGVAQAHQLRPEAIEPGTPIRSRELFAVPIVVKVHGGELGDTYFKPRPANYKVVWQVRNEDFFALRWGDPDFIRAHLEQNGTMRHYRIS